MTMQQPTQPKKPMQANKTLPPPWRAAQRAAKLALLCLATVVLVACGGGGSSPIASTPDTGNQTSMAVTTNANTTVLDSQQVGLISVDSSAEKTTLTLPKTSATASQLQVGRSVMVPAGQDKRFPFGLTGVVETVTPDNGNGQTVVGLRPATLNDVFDKSSVSASDVPLAAENFIAAIAPLAVGGGNSSPQQVGLIQKSVKALNGALTVRPAKLSGLDGLMAGVELPGNLGAGEITLTTEFKLSDLLSESENSLLKPYGKSGEAKVVVDIKLKNLKLTQKKEFEKVLGIPYALKTLDYQVQGTLSGDVKFSGGLDANLGYYSKAWHETEVQGGKWLGDNKLLGLDAKDKIGKIPLTGLVFSVPCAATVTCPVTPGNTMVPINAVSTGGVIVWVYLNAKGELKFEGDVGARANTDFNIGMFQPEGGELTEKLDIRRSTGAAVNSNFLEAPYIKGEIKASNTIGIALDVDGFFGGVRLVNLSMQAGARSDLNVNAEAAFVMPEFGQEMRPTGNACLSMTTGGGVITEFRAGIGAEIKTGWKKFDDKVTGKAGYEIISPEEADRVQPGWHETLGIPVWYTLNGASVCVPEPVISSAEVSRLSGGQRAWTLTGQNLPDDLELTVAQSGVCAEKPVYLLPATDRGTRATFTCTPGTANVADFSYSFSSAKASNLNSRAISGQWSAPAATLNASPTNPTVGQSVELWLSNAWSSIKSVVFSFVDGVASFATKAATVTDGVSQKISGFFTTAGTQTVTATYKDGSGNVLGSQSQTLTVQAGTNNNPSARIAGVIADSGSPTGAVPDQGTMSDNTPGLAGIVSADLSSLQSVRVYNGSTLLGTATVSGAAWTLQLPALADGTYVFRPVVYHAGTMTEGASENTWTVTIKTATSGGSGKLPHSGITASQCYSAGSNTLMTCSGVANDLNAQQDGHRASINPMSYSLVPKTGGGTYDKTECVKDDVTGLIWEGKTASGTRSGSNTYTNFDSSATGNKQNNGSDAAAAQVAAATNSMGYVTAVNAAALCGYTDWRLPTVDELQTIVDYSKPYPGPTINAAWFPNTPSYSYYWSSSRTVGGSHAAWVVHFYDGGILSNLRGYDDHVRLVRASQ